MATCTRREWIVQWVRAHAEVRHLGGGGVAISAMTAGAQIAKAVIGVPWLSVL